MIDTLPGERLIASMDADKVILTSMRLKIFTKGRVQAIQLNQVSYIEFEQKFKYEFIIIFALIVVAMAYMEAPGLMPVIAAGIGLAMFYKYQSKCIVIRSSGGAIRCDVSGIGQPDVARFMHLTEKAISELRH